MLGLGGDIRSTELSHGLTGGVGPAAVIPAVVPELDHAAVLDSVGLDPRDVFGVGLGERVADDPHRHDGLLGLGPFGHALEAGGEAFLLAGADVVELPDDDFVFCGVQRGEGEEAEQGEGSHG